RKINSSALGRQRGNSWPRRWPRTKIEAPRPRRWPGPQLELSHSTRYAVTRSYLAADGARRTRIVVECAFGNISLKAARYAAAEPETVRRIGEDRRPAVRESK